MDGLVVTWQEASAPVRLVVLALAQCVQQGLHLLWVPQGLSKHLLHVSHYGHFRMGFERIFSSLRGGGPFIRSSQ